MASYCTPIPSRKALSSGREGANANPRPLNCRITGVFFASDPEAGESGSGGAATATPPAVVSSATAGEAKLATSTASARQSQPRGFDGSRAGLRGAALGAALVVILLEVPRYGDKTPNWKVNACTFSTFMKFAAGKLLYRAPIVKRGTSRPVTMAAPSSAPRR